ncbi:MAG: beta-N-acetylhexosaminidase [Hydrogenophilus thermoluteolus]
MSERFTIAAPRWWIGVEGPALTARDRTRLVHPAVGGVILLARNWQTSAQLRRLTEAIRSVRDDLRIAVDHEGGRVQRFQGEGFTQLPPMRHLGAQWTTDPEAAVQTARRWGALAGRELAAHGIDVDFAPVVDLDDGRSRVIGDRAFSADPHITATLALAFADGLARAGVCPVFKHFPGHGGVVEDSHLELPTDSRSWDALWAADLVPYRQLVRAVATDGALLSGCGVMAALVRFPHCDDAPAAFSPFWLQTVLRERLQFAGWIASDDLGMAAANWAGATLAERGRAFFAAGGDVALACNDFAAIDRMLDAW